MGSPIKIVSTIPIVMKGMKGMGCFCISFTVFLFRIKYSIQKDAVRIEFSSTVKGKTGKCCPSRGVNHEGYVGVMMDMLIKALQSAPPQILATYKPTLRRVVTIMVPVQM